MLSSSFLEKVLADWNFWKSPLPVSIPRNILSRPFQWTNDLILVIQGVRRCGKSTLLTQILTQKKLLPRSCFFMNFEDPRVTDFLSFTLLDKIVEFAEKNAGSHEKLYFFFDEIQNIKGWEKWLNLKVERPGRCYFAITGSNSSLLSGELASRLTGRHLTIELFPFDFNEYRLIRPNHPFEDFLTEGGFPRTLTYEFPEQLLREYFIDIIERDIRRHVTVRSSLILQKLAKTVFETTGSETSQRNLSKALDLSTDTIGSYLEACEASYLLLPCPYFTFSEKKSAVRPKKYYPIDLGLRKAIITRTGMDRGKNLEAAVFHHLRRKYPQVYYWREHGEVDFVTYGNEGVQPYSVSWEGIQERHKESLSEFQVKFPQALSPLFIERKNAEEFLKSRS